MKTWQRAMAVTLFALLAGCASMPISSMLKLRLVDFSTTDLAILRAAVKMPDILNPEDARLNVEASYGEDLKRGGSFVLVEATETAPDDFMSDEVRPGERFVIYKLSDEDVAKLETLRKEVIALRQEAQHPAAMSISVRAKGCRAGKLPPGPLLMSTYLRTSETKTFVALAADLDLRKLAKGKKVDDEIKPCERA